MSPEIPQLLKKMSELAPPRDVHVLGDPHVVHTYQTLYMARLMVLIADDQAKSSEILERHTRALLDLGKALLNETKLLRWLTVGLLVLTTGLLIFTLCLVVRP